MGSGKDKETDRNITHMEKLSQNLLPEKGWGKSGLKRTRGGGGGLKKCKKCKVKTKGTKMCEEIGIN